MNTRLRAFHFGAAFLVVMGWIGGVWGCSSSVTPPPAVAGVGDLVSPALLMDQFGEEHAVNTSVRVLLIARDMTGGDVIKQVLGQSDPGLLGQIDGVYIADISDMPRLVSRLIAIPKMRERPYPILLDRTGSFSATLPSEEGRATLIRLEELRIRGIESFETPEELLVALGS